MPKKLWLAGDYGLLKASTLKVKIKKHTDTGILDNKSNHGNNSNQSSYTCM